jgi:SP family sugar:H+ symporter-like MFS transporter
MAFKGFHSKASSEHGNGPAKTERPSDNAIVAEQKITAIAIFLGMVASIGGFMFGYVR